LTITDFLFLLVIIPFFLSLFFLTVTVFYARKIRKLYRYLPMLSAFSPTKIEFCPLCSEKITRERFTRLIFLFPYTFKLVRHYEKSHKDIGKNARRMRISFTIFLWLTIHTFIAVVAARNVERVLNSQMTSLEVIPYFLVPYFSIQLVIWSIFAYLLLWKKGSIFEK
jgi:hypothetical protein